MHRFCIFLFLSLAISFIQATVLNVAIDGSQTYTSIQSAIQASSDGDTVLVHPGRYFENVDFLGKSINLYSLEAINEDSTYIASTIIDGNNSGSCIRIVTQVQNVSIRGFTLEHGSGTLKSGEDNEHAGGGVYIYQESNVLIANCDIKNNHTTQGSGIYVHQGQLHLGGVNIHDNYSTASVGGLYVYSHSSSPTGITFDPVNRCSIYNNFGGTGSDIIVVDVQASLDIYLDMASVVEPSNFYIQRVNNFTYTEGYYDTVHTLRAFREEVNHDLYVSPSGNDNNSGLSPAEAMKSITLAVHRIASDSLDVKTVHVLPGTYCEGDDDQIFPIPAKSYVHVIGESASACTLYTDVTHGSSVNHVLWANSKEQARFHGFTIASPTSIGLKLWAILAFYSNISFSDIVINDVNAHKRGVVYIYSMNRHTCNMDNIRISNVVTDEAVFSADMSGSMTNCTFENITSTFPDPHSYWILTMFDLSARGPLKVDNCVFRNFTVPGLQQPLHISDPNQPTGNVDISVSNCLFENLCTESDSPIGFNNRDVENFQVNNCTFINNRGASGTVGLTGRIYMKNNIFYNPESVDEIYLYSSAAYGINSNVYLDYNNIRGGESSINNPYSNNHVYYADTNITADPLFSSLEPGNSLFAMLSASSPCINSGIPDTTGVDILPYDLAGNWRVWNNRIDMGCYEYGSEPWVTIDDPIAPAVPINSLVAYPNPFSGLTNIKVRSLGSQSVRAEKIDKADITIYNIKGQRVKSISLDPATVSEQITYWDGRDADNIRCASGIYFINLMVNGKRISSKKVTFIR
jgi:hypothetical protein